MDGDLAGFIQRAERFANVEILEAGHMVGHSDVSWIHCGAFQRDQAEAWFGMCWSLMSCQPIFDWLPSLTGTYGSAEADAVAVCCVYTRPAL